MDSLFGPTTCAVQILGHRFDEAGRTKWDGYVGAWVTFLGKRQTDFEPILAPLNWAEVNFYVRSMRAGRDEP